VPAAARSAQVGEPIVWTSCGEQVECARVPVPLDWQHRDGPVIELALARRRASRPDERIGSLFVNFGGPGVAGTPPVMTNGAALDALGQGRFDVVGWDPRGTGDSTHVRCFTDERSEEEFWGADWSIPTTRSASQRYLPRTIAYGRRCSALSGDLLAHVSTADTVRDLDHLRQLVGDERLTYRGLSYGTFLGQTYASMFPNRVRAMVLDGVVDPVAFTRNLASSTSLGVADADLVFAQLQSLCERAGPTGCALAGHGEPVARRVRRLLARLRRAPIPAPGVNPPGELTYGDTLLVLWTTLGNPQSWPDRAAALEDAARGDGSALESIARDAKPVLQSALTSAVALQCSDKPAPQLGPQAWPQVIGALTRVSFISGPVNGWFLWAPCASWPVRSADRYTGPWRGAADHPILVIGTRFDPNTAFANAARVARRLGRDAVLLTHDGYGHTSDEDPSACVQHAVGAYLVDLVTPPRGTVCAADRVPFEHDFGAPLR
jgi:pimeloyl-ACP methyl ester carboxylesterase